MDWLLNNWLDIIGLLSGGIIWFFTKRHFQKKELNSLEIQNEISSVDKVGKVLDLYQELIDDLKVQYAEQKEKRDRDFKELSNKFDSYRDTVKKQRSIDKREIEGLRKELHKLKTDLEGCKGCKLLKKGHEQGTD